MKGHEFRCGHWPTPNSNEADFGENDRYEDTSFILTILENFTSLISQQLMYLDGKPLLLSNNAGNIAQKITRTKKHLGAAQLDGYSFNTKANFPVQNSCSSLTLMITCNATDLPMAIPHKYLKVNGGRKIWEGILSEESLQCKEAHPYLDQLKDYPILCALYNQIQVPLIQKGMKDTFTNICYIGSKFDYYHNLKKIYDIFKEDDTISTSLISDPPRQILLQELPSPAFGVSHILL